MISMPYKNYEDQKKANREARAKERLELKTLRQKIKQAEGDAQQ
jgi:hypothetical protein